VEGRTFGVGLCVVTQQPRNIDQKVLAQINTFVVMGIGDRGDRDIIMGSAKQDLSKMAIAIQTLDQGEAIISTIGIPFPVSNRVAGMVPSFRKILRPRFPFYATSGYRQLR
jgi:DNA helicase HerA-like ATPase